ncbi:MAG: penicillin acylase family protein [Acidobacteriota bacterium]|nr:MAG: penicillin acylase family protein [Acidobacteriota bacterium]
MDQPPGHGPSRSSPRPLRRPLRALVAVLAVVLAVTLMAAGGATIWLHARLRGSLPPLDGEHLVHGLSAPVVIERDALGVPTIRGRSRADVARALGFVHAQERFFQMDLSRRRAAGELAALFGRAALPADRAVRRHRFRPLAKRALEAASGRERALLEAYADGVNAGLAGLGEPPFEYLLLRQRPAAWRAEDSLLVVYAMYLLLQDEHARRERALELMFDTLPAPLASFLSAAGTPWDAPLNGGAIATPSIPGRDVIDVRGARPQREVARRDPILAEWEHRSEGSNCWAVDGAHSAHGGAILANDMHLDIAVPNTWFRAYIEWAEQSAGAGVRQQDEARNRFAVGLSLPGVPLIVAGSNGEIAWGFTNSYGDWLDIVPLEPSASDPQTSYLTPDGPLGYETFEERIEVAGGDPITASYSWTLWGPLVRGKDGTPPVALRWVAHDPAGVNLGLSGLETASSLDEALTVAASAGIPAQNLIVADASGRIGWTIAGPIPRRVGCDGSRPSAWADGSCRWDGYLKAEEYPRIVDPPEGRLWTANARVVDGPSLSLLGDGGYALGARASQIRDGLRGLERVSERDMLSIQLDDRALFLRRWRELLLTQLELDARHPARDPTRAELHRLVDNWGARASVESVGYRLVRAFRLFMAEETLTPLVAPCRRADPDFDYLGLFPQAEGPVWSVLTERPRHLLAPSYESWDDLGHAVVDRLIEYFTRDGTRLASRSWGERNMARIQHPLSRALPLASLWLDMPREPLPGDAHMPRVQAPSVGASARMVVSPGKERRGVLHMPCGQSGHPLSPFYRAGHDAWVRGEPTPLLPGARQHTLVLRPAPTAREDGDDRTN